jgi:uncharacterized C2H2 Zn-finger protein
LESIAERKVCQEPKLNGGGEAGKAFPSLQGGDKFVTPFGIVQVIKDDRAVPTASLPNDIKKRTRTYSNARLGVEAKLHNFYVFRAAQLRMRRNSINALYENSQWDCDALFEAYADPSPEKWVEPLRPENPSAPPGSFPDRIVECKWVPDQRSRDGVAHDHVPPSSNGKLFLRRDVLTQRYREDECLYSCPNCGQTFYAAPSFKYHVDNQPCLRKAELFKRKRSETEKRIQNTVEKLMQSLAAKKARNGQGGKARKTKMGIYPEVLIAMGFKVVTQAAYHDDDGDNAEGIDATIFMQPPASVDNPASQKRAEPEKIGSSAKVAPPGLPLQQQNVKKTKQVKEANDDEDADNPDEVLRRLNAEFQVHLRKADDQKYGSMYAEVYHALRFQYPGKKPGAKLGNNFSTKKRRKRAAKPQPPPPPPPPLPLPPVIDTRALTDELIAGRYPSMKRCTDVEHEDLCCICKNGGELLFCDFCRHAEHFNCIRKKFTVKRPEPKEDFLCHKCIQNVMARRSRAEKRRLRKLGKDEDQRIQDELLEESRKKSIRGSEYYLMAEKGQNLSELVELLRDSKVRVHQSIARMELNDMRRKVIDLETTSS